MSISDRALQRSAAVVLVVGGVILGSWAVVASGTESQSTDPPQRVAPSYGVAPGSTIRARPPRPHPNAGVPNQLRVPSMGIDVPVIGLDVVNGVLTPPDDPQMLGWWDDGARPGAVHGGALVTGHTVSSGGGALDDLEQVERGARVQVRTGKGLIDYRVTQVEIYRKARIADHAQRVFSQSGPGRLVLITCEDWNGEIYLSNVVVYAEPLRAS